MILDTFVIFIGFVLADFCPFNPTTYFTSFLTFFFFLGGLPSLRYADNSSSEMIGCSMFS
jgi:hypothetical protein